MSAPRWLCRGRRPGSGGGRGERQGSATPATRSPGRGSSTQPDGAGPSHVPSPGWEQGPGALGLKKHRRELAHILNLVLLGERSQGWRDWLPLPVQPRSRKTPRPSLQREQPLSPWDPHAGTSPSSARPQPAWSRAHHARDGHAASGEQLLLQLQGRGGGSGHKGGGQGRVSGRIRGCGRRERARAQAGAGRVKEGG